MAPEIDRQPVLRFSEFITLMALMISLAALSIDAMIPALPQIGADLGVKRDNDVQLVISFVILGMAFGQLIYGPLSDSVGRKPVIQAGFCIFIGGCLMSIFASSFAGMLTGRILQGIGVASPRSLTLALVRDQFEGRAMARIMSLVMAVFILVPTIAPALGQGILLIAHWRIIFIAFLVHALAAAIWFGLRHPETLSPDRKAPFSFKRITLALWAVIRNRKVMGYIMTSGFIFGAFIGYLSSSQQMFQGLYGLGKQFPAFMGVLALSFGSALLLNSRLVMRLGMRLLTRRSLTGLSCVSILFSVISFWLSGHPPLWTLMAYFAISFFCIGIMYGNLNALAMRPLGHIAGAGAAVVSSLSTLISVGLGIPIGACYNGTVLPIVGSFAILGIMSIGTLYWAEWRNE